MPKYEVHENEFFERNCVYIVEVDDEDEAYDIVLSGNAGPAESMEEYEWQSSEVTFVRLLEDEDEG